MKPLTGSLRRKLWLGFGGLLAILVAVSVLSVVVLTRYSRALEQVFRENYDSALYCDAMKASLDELHTRAQRLVWNDPGAALIDPAAEQNRFDENLRKQLGNVTLPNEKELTLHLRSLWEEYRSRLRALDVPGADRQAIYLTDLLPRYEELKSVARQVADMNMSNMVSVDGKAKRTLIAVRNALLILVVAGIVLAVALIAPVAARIMEPLQELIGSARQIESGDLNLTVDVTSRDEVGQLAEAFNSMASKLREFRRLDHDKLARTQQTTQMAIDSLPDAVCVIGPDGVVEISNRTAAAHFGISPGTTITALHLPWLSDLYEEVIREGKAPDPQGYKTAVQLFDQGHERFLLPRAVPMFDSLRRMIGVTVILVDVTGLRHGDELKSAFVSTVSHELRTPLTSVRMTVNMLADPKFGQLSDKQRQLLKAATDDSERLYRIIDNLLSMSRLEAGRTRVQLHRMAAAEIVAQAVDPLKRSFVEKGVQLTVAPAGNGASVMADPTCIGLALTNLLTNALKYTPAGGKVDVATNETSSDVTFTVADTGPGIPPHYVSHLFERFFRIPTENGPSGAGLGLAIAKEIVELHGGRIQFSPAKAGRAGSVFSYTLPLAGFHH